MKFKLTYLITLLALLLAACTSSTPAPAEEPADVPEQAPVEEARTLTVMVHDSFAVSDEVIAAFQDANNVEGHCITPILVSHAEDFHHDTKILHLLP